MTSSQPENKRSVFYAAAVAASLVVFVVLRARSIGHLLTWDEAMNLCSVRALSTLSSDHFSNWFWRHPPLFSLLMLFLRPLADGFAERVEMLCIAVAAVNFGLLIALNRKVFGRLTAALSAFFLAVMPGSMFFDVWVKRDHPVTALGLAALLLLVSRRPLYAGLCLGFALLCKETAVFYAIAAGLLWAAGAAGKRTCRDFLALALTPVATSMWWYRLPGAGEPAPDGVSWLDRIFGSAAQHVQLAFNAESGWAQPWNYYLRLLPEMLGTAGIALAGIGVAAALVLALHTDKHGGRGGTASTPSALARPGCNPALQSRAAMLWPLALLLPSYLGLSLLRSKVAWVPMVMFPGWATLQGVALAWLLIRPARLSPGGRTCGEPPPQRGIALPAAPPPVFRAALAGFILLGSLHCACRLDYDEQLAAIAPGQRRGAMYSKDAALVMNLAVRDDQRVLMTSFHYWQGILPGQACPVFAYYFRRNARVLMKPHETSFTELADDVKTCAIDWALLSPMPGAHEQEVFGGFVEKLKLQPIKLERAWLFRTSDISEQE